jgi:ABC-type polar amino acid transport system ATPase subunit
MSGLIEAVGIGLSYHGSRVLDDVSLSIAPGECVVILGPSGAGKSSALRCLAGIETLDGGRIEYRGDVVAAAGTRPTNLGGDIGMVFQQFNLFPHLSARDNVALAPRRVKHLPEREARERAEQTLASVGLADRMDYFPHELSGGQQQRVAIARALAMQPSLMLFDEPTSALDPEYTREVLAVMKDVIASGMTVAIVTHEMTFARDTADRVVFMDAGRVVETGPVQQFFAAPGTDRAQRFLEQTGTT